MQKSAFLTYVKYDFKRTDKDTEILQAYNDAIVQVSIQMPHGAYKYQSYIPLVEGQEDYPFPSSAMHIIYPLRILEGSTSTDSGYLLEKVSKEVYDARYPNPNRTSPTDKGSPKIVCPYSRSFLLGPLPDGQGWILEANWTKQPTDQSADADTPALPDFWREVLKQMTLDRVFAGIELHGEAEYWRSKYQDAEGNPVGLYAKLLELEEDNEGEAVGRMEANAL